MVCHSFLLKRRGQFVDNVRSQAFVKDFNDDANRFRPLTYFVRRMEIKDAKYFSEHSTWPFSDLAANINSLSITLRSEPDSRDLGSQVIRAVDGKRMAAIFHPFTTCRPPPSFQQPDTLLRINHAEDLTTMARLVRATMTG